MSFPGLIPLRTSTQAANGLKNAEAVHLVTRRKHWQALAAVLVLLPIAFMLDRPVYDVVHRHFNYYMRPVPVHMKIPTRVLRSFEDWGENVYILAIAVVIWRIDRRRRSQLVSLVISSLLVAGIVEATKRMTGRERPEVGNGAFVLHGPSQGFAGGDWQSFPSGHTAAAAAYSGTIAYYHPLVRPVAIVLAVGCGANRIWKERHFLSDCVVGGLFGYFVALLLPTWGPMRRLNAWFDRRYSETWPSA